MKINYLVQYCQGVLKETSPKLLHLPTPLLRPSINDIFTIAHYKSNNNIYEGNTNNLLFTWPKSGGKACAASPARTAIAVGCFLLMCSGSKESVKKVSPVKRLFEEKINYTKSY